MVSLGDAAQRFTSLRNGSNIKSELARLADGLSSGKVSDVTQALNGETTRLSGLTYSLTQLDAFAQANTETAQYFAAQQVVFDQVQTEQNLTAERLLLVSDASTKAQIDEAATAARDSFATMVQTLNTRVGDRSLLAGSAVDRVPLAPADTMLADIQAAIGGATDTATILAAIDTWFTDPAAGFAAVGYAGDTGAFGERRISDTKSVPLDARADDPAIVAGLKATATAAIAALLPNLTTQTKAELLQVSGTELFGAATGLTAVQARVGNNEAELASVQAENAAQTTVLATIQNDLTLADPFETATQLQAVQLQLETHFAVTARLSGLSLLRYI